MKASWMDKVVSHYKPKNTPRPHSSLCAYTGSGWGEEDYVAFTFLFQYQIVTTALGELLLLEDTAQSIS